jgi:hypothetical protein
LPRRLLSQEEPHEHERTAPCLEVGQNPLECIRCLHNAARTILAACSIREASAAVALPNGLYRASGSQVATTDHSARCRAFMIDSRPDKWSRTSSRCVRKLAYASNSRPVSGNPAQLSVRQIRAFSPSSTAYPHRYTDPSYRFALASAWASRRRPREILRTSLRASTAVIVCGGVPVGDRIRRTATVCPCAAPPPPPSASAAPRRRRPRCRSPPP